MLPNGIAFWGNSSTTLPGGTSLTVNQIAGDVGASLADGVAVYSAAKTSTVNVSGGIVTRPLMFAGNGNSSVVNLSGGQINGALDYQDATINTVTITGGSLNGNILFGTSTGTVYFNRGTSSTYSYAVSGAGSVVTSRGVTTLTQTNSYTGPTRIDAGGLVVNGALTNSAVTDYANASASVNDVLRLTGSTPFGTGLTSVNTKTLFLNFTKAALTVGTGTATTLQRGFFTDADFLSLIKNVCEHAARYCGLSGRDATEKSRLQREGSRSPSRACSPSVFSGTREKSGAAGTRTQDQRIKSPML